MKTVSCFCCKERYMLFIDCVMAQLVDGNSENYQPTYIPLKGTCLTRVFEELCELYRHLPLEQNCMWFEKTVVQIPWMFDPCISRIDSFFEGRGAPKWYKHISIFKSSVCCVCDYCVYLLRQRSDRLYQTKSHKFVLKLDIFQFQTSSWRLRSNLSRFF